MKKTFKEIAPTWAKVLENLSNIDIETMIEEELHIGNFDMCIVGEAYHFDAPYARDENGCKICYKYSNDMGNLLSYLSYITFERDSLDNKTKRAFRKVQRSFVSHFNNKHSELID